MHFTCLALGSIFLVLESVVASPIPDTCRVKLSMPDECEGKSICTKKPKEYPHSCFNTITQQFDFKIIEGDENIIPVSKNGDTSFNDNDCKRTQINETIIYMIIDTNNEMRVVVQSDSFKQMIHQEICLEPEKPLQNSEIFLGSYKEFIYSEQITLDYNFLVLNHERTDVEYARSKDGVPVACTCRLRDY